MQSETGFGMDIGMKWIEYFMYIHNNGQIKTWILLSQMPVKSSSPSNNLTLLDGMNTA